MYDIWQPDIGLRGRAAQMDYCLCPILSGEEHLTLYIQHAHIHEAYSPVSLIMDNCQYTIRTTTPCHLLAAISTKTLGSFYVSFPPLISIPFPSLSTFTGRVIFHLSLPP